MTEIEFVAAGYMVVEPRYTTFGSVKSIRLDRITQQRPTNLQGGEVAFRLEVALPASVFKPIGDVVINVPEGEIIEPEVTVG